MAKKLSYILFKLGNDTFAIDVLNVIQTLETEDLTPLPKTPEFVKGIMIFRGNILPVIDLRLKFNIKNTQELNKGFIIVTKFFNNEKEQEIGLIVDSVLEVSDFDAYDIGTYPEIGSKYNLEFINGFVKQDDEIITVLNIENILSSAEIEILKKSTEKIEFDIENE